MATILMSRYIIGDLSASSTLVNVLLNFNIYIQLMKPLNPTTDIDECDMDTDNCHSYATCNNTIGSFTCTCDEGFMGDGVNCAG